MVQCIGCKDEIEDIRTDEVLQIYIDTGKPAHRRLLEELKYKLPTMLHSAASYVHFKCLAPHRDLLDREERQKLLEWRVKELEREAAERDLLMERICQALKQMDGNTYYELIEEPYLK